MGRVFTDGGEKKQFSVSPFSISVGTLLRVNHLLEDEWHRVKYYVNKYPAKRDWSRVKQCLNILVTLGIVDTKTVQGTKLYRKNPNVTNLKKLRTEVKKETKVFNADCSALLALWSNPRLYARFWFMPDLLSGIS